MEVFCPSLGALAVAMVFYAYRDLRQQRVVQQRLLCDRVSFLLWTMAEQMS